MIIHGDCIEELKKLDENSVDAIITDPPYGLGFMGKEWDKLWDKGAETDYKRKGFGKSVLQAPIYKAGFEAQQFHNNWSKECLRVLKPGGFLLSFGGTRTYHRMVCGIEDAGFEIRDTIMWLYGSGFPKSLNIGKQIDKLQGNERKVVGTSKNEKDFRDVGKKVKEIEGIDKLSFGLIENADRKELDITKGNSEWEGWGTALKPAHEPIVVARKPLSEKNVALNVLKWRTGGINIDACRIGHNEPFKKANRKPIAGQVFNEDTVGFDNLKNIKASADPKGRFPANIILDEEAGKILDEQSGVLGSNSLAVRKTGNSGGTGNCYQTSNDVPGNIVSIPGKGGASRFFYCAKASKSERNYGCEDLEEKESGIRSETSGQHITRRDGGDPKPTKNNHPTVKPIKLMEYLIKLVTKEGAVVLDPFVGSGTTLLACHKLNRQCIGIEKEEEYIKIAQARINKLMEQKQLNSQLTPNK